MEIDWRLVTIFVVGYFALSGYSRGWWREAIVTGALALLIGMLQFPDFAAMVINTFNTIFATAWGLGVPFINMVFATSFNPTAPQFAPGDQNTWIVTLFVIAGAAVVLGRGMSQQPTLLGSILGLGLGAINGLLALSLVREYLDGRALPGNATAESSIYLEGSSAFGEPVSTVAFQLSDLPSLTVMDSAFPYVVLGVGTLLLFTVLNTRFGIKKDDKKGSKLDYLTPPFYKAPGPPPKGDSDKLLEKLAKTVKEALG